MRFITDRIRVFLFGIAIALMGLYSPQKTIQAISKVLDV